MCSFIVTNKILKDLDKVNFFTKFRGPDKTNVEVIEGFTFVHNLLSITGEFTPQPFVKDDIVCLYNGELYNKEAKNYPSDGGCLIDLYKEHGNSFTKHLDGEFAIVLFDFSKNQLLISTDTFSTKPLWCCMENGDIGISSYKTPLIELGFSNPSKLHANTTLAFDLNSIGLKYYSEVTKFDLNQHVTDFDSWTESFKDSIRKRVDGIREGVFIGLSSGYDSGAICCELLAQKQKFKAYTVIGSENMEVLAKRRDLVIGSGNEHEVLTFHKGLWNVAHKHITDNVEDFKYTIRSSSSDYNEFWLSLKDDNGSNGLSFISSLAKRDNKKIYLSGQGADELFSDYGFGGVKKYPHSNFGGLFPEDLGSVFPWPSVYNSSMESYLAKEEHVAGSYGLEARYPFLDPKVVQEFLWLTPELKNSNYKSVLHNYLQENDFPMAVNEKIGF